jgi:cytochrome o ubiquinol oxidase subunit 3
MEIYEFHNLIRDGATFTRSAFLSSYFSLVGTHGASHRCRPFVDYYYAFYHFRRGLSESTARKLTLLSFFWHFLDIVWIFIFTIVYLMGSM